MNILLYLLYCASVHLFITLFIYHLIFDAFQSKLTMFVFLMPTHFIQQVYHELGLIYLLFLSQKLHIAKDINPKCTIWYILTNIYTCATYRSHRLCLCKIQNTTIALESLLRTHSRISICCSDFFFHYRLVLPVQNFIERESHNMRFLCKASFTQHVFEIYACYWVYQQLVWFLFY